MPSIEDVEKPAEPKKEIIPVKSSEIGIIYPPPEVRNIVDKTASFVARNGPEFESRIRQNELNNVKFNFLASNDPYNGYYQHKVSEFKAGRGGVEPVAPKPSFRQIPGQQINDTSKIAISAKPLEPPTEFEFIAESQTISAYDLDVVKLTAQFTARNGREFLTSLINQQQRNYQFDFLRPQHSLFTYFTKLVEQYTKVLLPPKNLMDTLMTESKDQEIIMKQVKGRLDWERHVLMEKNRADEAKEKERVAYAQIDWHSFVVVETVDYQAGETGHLPPPTTPEEVGARVLAQQRLEDNDPEMVEMEVESSDEEGDDRKTMKNDDNNMDEGSDLEEGNLMANRSLPNSAPTVVAPEAAMPPMPEHVIVRKDYDPKSATGGSELLGSMPLGAAGSHYLISPLTGERIRADLMTEHMRIALLDPKWTEQRDKIAAEKRERRDIFAPDSTIGSHLKQFAGRRTDIFGYGNEEKNIGEKIGDSEDPLRRMAAQKMVWDGHSGTKEKVAQTARDNITTEDKMNVIKHKMAEKVAQEKIGVQAKPPIPSMPPPPQHTMPRPPVQAMGPPMGSFARHPISRMPMQMNMPPHRPPPPPGQYGMQMQGMRMPMGGEQIPRPPIGAPPRPPPMGGQRMPILPMRQPPLAMRQPMLSQHHQQMNHPHPEMEPPVKRSRTEDSLIPESMFLQKHQGNVTFDVAIPNMPEKSEWKLNGQSISITLSLTDMVTSLKMKLHEITGMPSGKQKIQVDGLFVKDTNSMAFYNTTGSSHVVLQIKERGGRKK